MPAARPIHLREQVTKAWRSGRLSWRDLAERFGISRRTVARWLRRQRDGGSLESASRVVSRPLALATGEMETLRSLVGLHANASHRQLAVTLAELTGTRVSRSTITRALAQIRGSGATGSTPAAIRGSRAIPIG
jgi:transposase